MRISVVIPTRNRREHLEECLKSLFEANPLPNEVIVLDAGSTDGTEEAVKQYSITFVRVNEPNRQRQRNIGLSKTTGEIVVFLDDDVVIDKPALRHIMNAYSIDVGGVGGRILPYGMPRNYWVAACGNIVGKVRNDGVVIGNFDIPLKKSKEVDCLQGCFMSFRREALQKVGGFDENYASFFRGDDTDVSFVVKKRGYKLIYEPKAIVWHKALGKRSYSTENWAYFYIRGCTYFYFKNVFPRAKRYFPWFLKGLFSPPKDYAKKSSIKIRLTPSLPLTILHGIIDGMLPHFRKMLCKPRFLDTNSSKWLDKT